MEKNVVKLFNQLRISVSYQSKVNYKSSVELNAFMQRSSDTSKKKLLRKTEDEGSTGSVLLCSASGMHVNVDRVEIEEKIFQ